MEESIESLLDRAKKKKKTHKKFLQSLKKVSPKLLDATFAELHEAVFSEFSCLNCANCCKTLGPKFISQDIDRISRHLNLPVGVFVERYLKMDEDGDWVLQHIPCSFLGEENRCSIYEVRPKACRTYPRTDSRGMHRYLDITYKNTLTCPAVLQIVERMQEPKAWE